MKDVLRKIRRASRDAFDAAKLASGSEQRRAFVGAGAQECVLGQNRDLRLGKLAATRLRPRILSALTIVPAANVFS